MARTLVCTDAQPNSDGTCTETAWIEQVTVADFVPELQTAVEVGVAYMSTLIVLAAVRQIFKPRGKET